MDKQDFKRRLEMNENFTLKIMSELGDLSRIIRGLIARIDKLENQLKKEKEKNKNV